MASNPQHTLRLVFVDLLRGWAVIVMFETHVFNAMLSANLREGWWFDVLNFVNGMVAPSFLFVSGFVFVLSAKRKVGQYRAFGPVFWKQIGRMLVILVIAYGLHLPFFSYRKIMGGVDVEGWLKFYQVDILHCIVAGWFFLLASFMLIRSESTLRRWIFASGVAFVLAAPFIWDIDFVPYVPAPLAAFLNAQHYSIFPIFPWLGFMLAGCYTGLTYLDAVALGDGSGGKQFVRRAVILAGVLVILSSILSLVSMQIPLASASWRANPLFFSLRLGIILLFMGACWLYAERRSAGRSSQSSSSFVLDISRESFLVYTLHLLIIYGKYLREKNLVDLYGGTLGVAECVVWSIVLTLLMVAVAKVWGRIKRESLFMSRAISYGIAVVVTIAFFIRQN